MRVGLFKSPSTAGRPRPGQSVRGKISSPIPQGTPIEDDEFPMRQPGTGAATPLGNEKTRSQLRTPPEGVSTVISARTPEQGHHDSEAMEPQPDRTPISGSPANSQPTQVNTQSPLRYSAISNGTDTDQGTDRAQPKKSTLKSALGKLFGRKKKPTSQSSGSESMLRGKSSSAHHRSDPSALSRAQTNKESEPKRSTSLPITEFDRALRSHSVGPDDMIAIVSARNSLQVEPSKPRRRATTASSMHQHSHPFPSGLSPRPASMHSRALQNEPHDEDPETIGRALSIDPYSQRRRSQSLSQLPASSIVPGELVRREIGSRDEEIMFWRQSYDQILSPMSSNPNEFDDPIPTGAESPAHTKPRTPPQPFDFQIAGMKITQAASLEQRIAALEVRNEKLEKLVAQLFQFVPGVNTYPDTPERDTAVDYSPPSGLGLRSTYRTNTNELQASSRYSPSRQSHDSLGDVPTVVEHSLPERLMIQTNKRPTSDATIVRAVSSLPQLPREMSGPFTADHYTTLLALVETERSARQALESQLTQLNHKLNLMMNESRGFDAYQAYSKAPSSAFDEDDDPPADDDFSGSEAFKTPREERGAFGELLRSDDEDPVRKKAARTLSLSQLTKPSPTN